jgi:two-component system, OmpR family, phosphate regulon response regulator PhoB
MAKILIIEDDGDLQNMLSVALNQENYEMHYAFNGKEGYEKVLSMQPDVILLDLMMPVLNGVEVIKLVTSNTLVRDIPIIVMTAHGDKADMLESSIKAQGVREYLRKPFAIANLKSIIKRMLAQYPRRVLAPSQVAKGVVRLDTQFRTLWIDDRMVATLSPTKAKVLRQLLEARGPVKREKLLHAVWGDQGSAAALEKTVQRLREDLGEHARRLQTTLEGYELIG